jgi:hypothetical protein
MSSPIALMSAAAVALAGIAFLVTDGAPPEPAEVSLAAAPAPTEPTVTIPATKPTKPKRPAVQRSEVYVDVYNNSNITGLAGQTADRIGGAGWQVVGSDNWYGTIPSTTIYFPPRLQEAAKMLSRDLGINRVLPAVAPMNMDRLTVILTADFA